MFMAVLDLGADELLHEVGIGGPQEEGPRDGIIRHFRGGGGQPLLVGDSPEELPILLVEDGINVMDPGVPEGGGRGGV